MLLQNDTDYQDEIFKNIIESNQDFFKIQFDHCHFTNCDFSSTQFLSCSFENCSFENSNLSNIRIKDCIFRDTTFTSCKLIGILWYECRQKSFTLSIKFKETVIDYSSFYKLDLQKCSFEDVHATEVDFTEANLCKCKFNNTNLSGTTFIHCNLKKADFSTAVNYQFNLSENQVKDAIFSLPDAIHLLYSFGIKIQ